MIKILVLGGTHDKTFITRHTRPWSIAMPDGEQYRRVDWWAFGRCYPLYCAHKLLISSVEINRLIVETGLDALPEPSATRSTG